MIVGLGLLQFTSSILLKQDFSRVFMHKDTFLPQLNHHRNRQTVNLMITVNLMCTLLSDNVSSLLLSLTPKLYWLPPPSFCMTCSPTSSISVHEAENVEGSNFQGFWGFCLTPKMLSLNFCQKSRTDTASLLSQYYITIHYFLTMLAPYSPLVHNWLCVLITNITLFVIGRNWRFSENILSAHKTWPTSSAPALVKIKA